MKLTIDRQAITPAIHRYFEVSDERTGNIYIFIEIVSADGTVLDCFLRDVDGDEVKESRIFDEIQTFVGFVPKSKPMNKPESKKKKNKTMRCRECGGDRNRSMDPRKPVSLVNLCPLCGKN